MVPDSILGVFCVWVETVGKRGGKIMRALVFGKFLPFHNGHLAMIDYAQKKYDNVTAVVFSL